MLVRSEGRVAQANAGGIRYGIGKRRAGRFLNGFSGPEEPGCGPLDPLHRDLMLPNSGTG